MYNNNKINCVSLREEIWEKGKLACCYMSLAITGGDHPCMCLNRAGREERERRKEEVSFQA